MLAYIVYTLCKSDDPYQLVLLFSTLKQHDENDDQELVYTVSVCILLVSVRQPTPFFLLDIRTFVISSYKQ